MRFNYIFRHSISLAQWARCLWNRGTEQLPVKNKYYYLITEERTNTFKRKVSGDVRSEEINTTATHTQNSLKEQGFGVSSCHLLHNCTVSSTAVPQNHGGQKNCGNCLSCSCFFPHLLPTFFSFPFTLHSALVLLPKISLLVEKDTSILLILQSVGFWLVCIFF